jgi:hypothetical protein
MNANDSLERRLTDFYESEGPPRAPDWVLRSALQTIDDTPQRRVIIRVPWRSTNMKTFAKVAIAAVVVIAVGAVGLSVLRPPSSSNVGGQPTASPSPSPSLTIGPSPSSSVTVPALTETFTSERNGFSISYPTGWVTRPATDPWTTGYPDFASTGGDIIYDPVLEHNLWIMIASQPLAGKSATQWLDDLLAGLGPADICHAPSEPVTIDGTQGRLCGASAATSAGDRGYLIWLYTSGDDPAAVAGYDQAYFNDILATLQLRPEDAVDTPASPSPSA